MVVACYLIFANFCTLINIKKKVWTSRLGFLSAFV